MLRQAAVDAAGEESGEKDEAFGGGDETERLIDVGGSDGGEMGAGDPDEHQPAKGVELNAATAGLFAAGK